MFKILYATDGSEDAFAARKFLQSLPLPEGTEIDVLAVVEEPPPWVGAGAEGAWINQQTLYEIAVTERERCLKLVDREAELLTRPGVTTRPRLREGDVSREIAATAEELSVDLIITGSRGLTGIDRLLLGSVAQNVAHRSRRPVLVAREPKGGVTRCVFATDGSDHSKHAAAFTARLPLPAEAATTCVHVLKPYNPFRGLLPTDGVAFDAAVEEVRERHREQATEMTAEAVAALTAAGKNAASLVREGDPATELLALAEEQQADLIIAGARGVSLIEGLVVGSVADKLLKEAHCSVLLVR